ncbi:MAG: hypothetical protein DRI69_06795 [Bacteroidetes bacterium]|nr:MAG: hypothetical protein DRI69_06795 [Bacteroidota bacterium]
MLRIILIFISVISVSCLSGQSIYTEFGKNRVQYHDDFENWWMYETPNFVTYWYGKGRNVAQSVIQLAELDNDMIQKVLEHRFNDKIQIIVYLDVTDMKQSNIGSEELFSSKTGRTRILGNKMFVYFDGDHQKLRKSIRQGIAAIYLESMLYGANFQEKVQNAVLLNLPDWFKEGLIAYMGNEWNSDIDNRLRDIFMHPKGRYKDFDRLARDYPLIAGHSMWYYIGQTYGKSSISNLLYLSRINRNLENAFLYVIGSDIDQIKDNWQVFYESRYSDQANTLDPYDAELVVDIRNKRNLTFGALSLSPNGKYLTYSLNELGKIKLYIRELESGKTMRILKTGIRNIIQETDYNYPLTAWHPDGNVLSVVYEKRDVIYLTQIDLVENVEVTHPLNPEYDRIYSMDYWATDTLLFAASQDGFSDLYKYTPVTRQTFQITEDFYDDLDAGVYTLGGYKGILWRSNRTNLALKKRKLDTILPVENFDIYFMFPDSTGWQLLNLTQTPYDNEKKPVAIGGSSVIYLTNESGVWNRKAVTGPLSEKKAYDFITKYDRSIIDHTSAPGAGRIFEYLVIDSKHTLLESLPEKIDPIIIQPSQEENILIVDGVESKNRDELDVVDERFLFQSQFSKPEVPETSPADKTESKDTGAEAIVDFLATPVTDTDPVTYDPTKVLEYRPSKAIAHRLRFRLDHVTTTLDNSLLFSSLDTYAGTKQGYESPPIGILIKANVQDLFEDYIIEAGVRFPTTFNGSEYFIVFNNKKKRIDKQLGLYRKTETNTVPGGIYSPRKDQVVTVIAQASARYPIDVYRSVLVSGTIRNDRIINLSTDFPTLESPTDDQQRIGVKIEYIFDNTLEFDVNYRHGTRYKVFVDLVKRFDLNLFEENMPITFKNGFMTVLGVDARHYQRLDKHSIFAARFYASTSFGSERILHYLGGVENWMFSEFDNTVPVPRDKNFAYQTIAANMRGFKYNARNGSSVALINTELRVPFLRYLSRKKFKSSFLRNMQVVGFIDAGTAWHGSDPFSSDNPLNTLTITNPPTVKVDVTYYRNPIVVGYGFGVRTMILGYFLKLDYGWGLETHRVSKPILHFSMGLDF